jgi:hypothetical protein
MAIAQIASTASQILRHGQDHDLDAAAQRRLRLERVERVLERLELGQASLRQSASPEALAIAEEVDV